MADAITPHTKIRGLTPSQRPLPRPLYATPLGLMGGGRTLSQSSGDASTLGYDTKRRWRKNELSITDYCPPDYAQVAASGFDRADATLRMMRMEV
jgi:hypothetical protein